MGESLNVRIYLRLSEVAVRTSKECELEMSV